MVDFDDYANDYERTLNDGLAISGENKDYFAEQRVRWIENRLNGLGAVVQTVLDFGCGVGTNILPLLRIDSLKHLTGIDVSEESLVLARREFPDERVHFLPQESFTPDANMDLVFCNGVFHHVAPDLRPKLLGVVRDSLKPGGYFAFWENNIWNPGTRFLMSRLPFDRDAIPIAPSEGRRLLRQAGFEIIVVDFLFVFPRQLSALRFIEPWICRAPLGAQYLVLGMNPK